MLIAKCPFSVQFYGVTTGVDPKKYEGRTFVPYDKGGESDTSEGWLPNYYVQTEYFINWSKLSVNQLRSRTIADVKRRKKEVNKIRQGDETKIAAYIRNPSYYFRDGLTFSRTGNYAPTFRLASGSGFDSKSDGLFLIDESQDILTLLGVLNSTLIRYLTKVFLSHTVQAEGDALLEIPIIPIDQRTSKIKDLVKTIVDKQKRDPRYPYHMYEQKQLDEFIYQLYGVDDKDVREIKLWYCRRYQRLARSQGVWDEIEQNDETD
ncbi:MAG TPA: hypothetical protein VK206_18270 [Anaerolineales bacterium]|nr:hypothetical protein [Anaerolineales bacterium]